MSDLRDIGYRIEEGDWGLGGGCLGVSVHTLFFYAECDVMG